MMRAGRARPVIVMPAKAGIQYASAYPRHCERSEAIHISTRGWMDCFAALAMTADCL
jgi:hypothetical protein